MHEARVSFDYAPVNLTRHFLDNRNGRTTKERATGLNKRIQ